MATKRAARRSETIVDVLDAAFAPLMEADPAAFRAKYRKMARDPHAFYRGTACLFDHDVTSAEDPYVDDRCATIWIHGDLHVENFGTYLASNGRLTFDINDFDEAYLGHYTWDLQRFAASLALIGWQKALPEAEVRALVARYVRAYLQQINHYLRAEDDDDFSLDLTTAKGAVLEALADARLIRRADLLDGMTHVEDGVRVFTQGGTTRRLGRTERRKVEKAFEGYLQTIPEHKRADIDLFYDVRDIVGVSGFGIGSAGLPAYNVLVEGYSQALDNDVVLSMKQANVPALSRFVDNTEVAAYFEHEGQRTVVSQRALQANTDAMLGYTTIDGTGYVVAEISPYEVDLSWDDISEPEEIAEVVDQLGRATAKIHCASDEDSEQDLVDFQVEEAIAEAVEGRRKELTEHLVQFGIDYSHTVREDHALFVDAFREGRIGITAT